jgi:hypothetical protein
MGEWREAYRREKRRERRGIAWSGGNGTSLPADKKRKAVKCRGKAENRGE